MILAADAQSARRLAPRKFSRNIHRAMVAMDRVAIARSGPRCRSARLLLTEPAARQAVAAQMLFHRKSLEWPSWWNRSTLRGAIQSGLFYSDIDKIGKAIIAN